MVVTMESSLHGNYLVSTGANWEQTRSNILFVQACYEPIYDTAIKVMQENEHVEGVFIVGNPGIGKSCFLDYALHRLRQDNKHVVYLFAPPGKEYIYRYDGDVTKFPMQQALDGRSC